MNNTRLGVTLGAVLLGTVVFAQSVTYDFDRSADFAAFRTYAWVSGTILNDELNHQRIVNAVDAQLTAKGLSKVASDPDLLVAYHATFDRNLRISGFSSGWGGYRFGGNRTGSARAEEILVGTLAVDLVNAATNTIVWRAMATKDIDVKASPEKREKNINRTAQKLFQSYPPEGSGKSSNP
jgi:hypothetical protein